MKKLIVSILAILYIGTSAGATVHLHFCMNQLISWQPYKGDTGKCENCGMTKDVSQKNGCCTDKQHFVKSNTDHKLQPVFGLQASIHFTALPSAYIGWPASSYTAILPTATPQQTRPIPMGPALYLRNAVFRI